MKLQQIRQPTGAWPRPVTPGRLIWVYLLMPGLLAILLAGCAPVATLTPTATVDPGPFYTQAAETLVAGLTAAAPTTTPTPEPSPTPLPPSLTSTPTETPAPSPTSVFTPTESPPPTPEPPALPCNQVQFLGDISESNRTTFYPGESFVRTWLIYNTGRCEWNIAYSIQFVSGELMGNQDSFAFTNYVPPEESTTLNLILTAPNNPGIHRSGWMLRSDAGELFGTGPEGVNLFWVEIQVVEPPVSYYYDFANSYCAATWENEFGTLPCPGDTASQNGFVIRLESADLESHREDEPLIWTQPSIYNNSWIRGIFPAIRIKDGDHFLADIGCLDGYKECDVVFQLNYRIPGGVTQNLGEWREDQDGHITRVNVDLSNLAGRSVELILTTLSNGPSTDDAAFWLMPHIENID